MDLKREAASTVALIILFGIAATLLRPLVHRDAYVRRGWSSGSVPTDLKLQFANFTDLGVNWSARMGWWGGAIGLLAWSIHQRLDESEETFPRLWEWLGTGVAYGASAGVLIAIWLGWFGPIAESLVTDYRPIVKRRAAELAEEKRTPTHESGGSSHPKRSSSRDPRQHRRRR